MQRFPLRAAHIEIKFISASDLLCECHPFLPWCFGKNDTNKTITVPAWVALDSAFLIGSHCLFRSAGRVIYANASSRSRRKRQKSMRLA